MTKRSIFRRACAVGLTALLLSTTGCATSPEVSVREYVDQAIAGLDDGYYADSPEWDEAVEEALPELYAADSIRGTYGILGRLTKVAGGKHSSFSRPADVAAWEGMYELTGVPLPTVEYDGRVAIVTLPAFSSSDPAERDLYMNGVAEAFASERGKSACGWVIDLSANGGGSMWTMLAAMSPLLDDGVVETFHARDGSVSDVVVEGNTVTWDDQEWGVLPGAPIKLPHRPIGIVQSIMTASAAESVILSFTGQERVETFGTGTGGFTTVNTGVDLPDGAVITLSFALMGDRDGNSFDGPIAPDHDVDRFQESALEDAQNWVATQCPS